jgi:acyl dehydratase
MLKQIKSTKAGEEFPKIIKDPVTRVQIAKYAGASGDFNPLHLDDAPGVALGAGGVIAHGMLIMGFVGQAVTSWVPKQALRKFGVRFVGMTRPGDTITVSGKVKDVKQEADEYRLTCEVTASDNEGNIKLVGLFVAYLPPIAEILLIDSR